MEKRLEVSLSVGDLLDVMDSEGTWNVARVIDIRTQTQVEAQYDGWDSTYNEVVELNSERVAPYHTYTWAVRCWARYKNWPWWPAVVTIRAPGTQDGITYLKSQTRLYVDFLDKPGLGGRTVCWVEKDRVQSFGTNRENRRQRRTGADFEASYARALQSTAMDDFPTFLQGTLPIEYSNASTPSIKTTQKMIGALAWQSGYVNNRIRHQQIYQYDTVIENVSDRQETPAKKKRKQVSVGSKRPAPQTKKVEQEPNVAPTLPSLSREPAAEKMQVKPEGLVEPVVPVVPTVPLSSVAKRPRQTVSVPPPAVNTDEMSIIVLPSDDSDDEQYLWLSSETKASTPATTALPVSHEKVPASSLPLDNVPANVEVAVNTRDQTPQHDGDTSLMDEAEGYEYEHENIDDKEEEDSGEELIPLDPLDDWGMMRDTSLTRVASTSPVDNTPQTTVTSLLSLPNSTLVVESRAEQSAISVTAASSDNGIISKDDDGLEHRQSSGDNNVLERLESTLSVDKSKVNGGKVDGYAPPATIDMPAIVQVQTTTGPSTEIFENRTSKEKTLTTIPFDGEKNEVKPAELSSTRQELGPSKGSVATSPTSKIATSLPNKRISAYRRRRSPLSSFMTNVMDTSDSLLKWSAFQFVQTLPPPPPSVVSTQVEPKVLTDGIRVQEDRVGIDKNAVGATAANVSPRLVKMRTATSQDPTTPAFKLPRGKSYVQVLGTPKYVDEWLMTESTSGPKSDSSSPSPARAAAKPLRIHPDTIQSSTSLTTLRFSSTRSTFWDQTSKDFTLDRWFKRTLYSKPGTPS